MDFSYTTLDKAHDAYDAIVNKFRVAQEIMATIADGTVVGMVENFVDCALEGFHYSTMREEVGTITDGFEDFLVWKYEDLASVDLEWLNDFLGFISYYMLKEIENNCFLYPIPEDIYDIVDLYDEHKEDYQSFLTKE